MAESMALDSPEGTFEQNEAAMNGLPSDNNELVSAESPNQDNLPATFMGSPAVRNFLDQPLVKRTIPALIGLFCLLLFLMVYSPIYSTVGRSRGRRSNKSGTNRG